MKRIFVKGLEINVTFFQNVSFVTEAASDYSCFMKYENNKVRIIEEHGISEEGRKIVDFIVDRNIIAETDPEFYDFVNELKMK